MKGKKRMPLARLMRANPLLDLLFSATPKMESLVLGISKDKQLSPFDTKCFLNLNKNLWPISIFLYLKITTSPKWGIFGTKSISSSGSRLGNMLELLGCIRNLILCLLAITRILWPKGIINLSLNMEGINQKNLNRSIVNNSV